jgi:tRNA threonylcarbamoyladenosine biosynthesis protein TsaB
MSLRILAIDTATEACSVALYDGGETRAYFELCPREHTQRILPLVQQILSESGLALKQLDALAFGRGPGSFTGVRIGIGIAQGLALGAALPLLPVSTLLAMAQQAYRLHGAQQVLTAIDARMGEVYWAQYQRLHSGQWTGEQSESVLKPEQLSAQGLQLNGQWFTVGTGWQTYPQLFAEYQPQLVASDVLLPAAEDMLPLACQAWQQGVRIAPEHAEPVYLRNEVTWKKLPGRE